MSDVVYTREDVLTLAIRNLLKQAWRPLQWDMPCNEAALESAVEQAIREADVELIERARKQQTSSKQSKPRERRSVV